MKTGERRNKKRDTSEQYVERDICECRQTFREKLGREATEKEK